MSHKMRTSRILLGGIALGLSLMGAPLAAQQAVVSSDALTLTEVVRTALDRSREIRQASFALDEAEERVSEAWGSVFPKIDLAGSYARNLTPSVNFLPAIFFNPQAGPDELVPVQFGADNIWTTSVDVEQPILDARSFLGLGAAGRYRSLQGEALRSRTQTVVTRVRVRYYDLLLAQEQERLLDNSVRRVRESLAQAQALHRAGLSSEYDVLRLEVELANLEPNLRRASNSIAQARRMLAVELDRTDADKIVLVGSLATMEFDDPDANSADNRAILAFGGTEAADPDALVQLALGARSDLRQLQFTEDLRRTELRVEQVAYFPTLNFFGSYNIAAQQNGSPQFFGSPRAYGRTVGLRLSFPIFNGFQREARIDQKRAVLRGAQIQTELAASQAAVDVQGLVDQVEEARFRARGQRLAVRQAQRGFEIASAQRREGLSSQLELTDAEVALRQSEFNYAQAVYDYLASRARLDEATGRVPMVDDTGDGR